MNIQILEFRQITKDDICDTTKYGHWSRFYEYPIVNKFLRDNLPSDAKIHNTSWGFEPPNHTDFKDDLESYFGIENIVNSDIKSSAYPNTTIYDITTPPKDEWIEHFDAVLNISTIEEIPHNQINCFENLLLQVKKGGYLIITFDLPGLNLREFEVFLSRDFTTSSNNIYHPPKIGFTPYGLSVGLLICKKN